MNGALPPNSSDNFLTVPAHCYISNLLISVEPVKVSLRTVGFEVISPPPISFEPPVTQEKTPFGTPARSANSHSANAQLGAVAGFSTSGRCRLPLPVMIAAGKCRGGLVRPTEPVVIRIL